MDRVPGTSGGDGSGSLHAPSENPVSRFDVRTQSFVSPSAYRGRCINSGWHFDAIGISSLSNLRSLTLRAEDDDGLADMAELLTTLNANSSTLTHLCLSAYLARPHSWDSAFQSPTIDHLTCLDLVDTKISHFVLRRIITCSERLTHLTLHGTFEDPRSAQVLFEADHVLEGHHTFLPLLESFRFLVVDHDDDMALHRAVVRFVGQRKRLRRLDLGRCPWELVAMVLPELEGLRAVRVRIGRVVESVIDALTKALSEHLVALHLCAVVADKSLVRPFPFLSRLLVSG